VIVVTGENRLARPKRRHHYSRPVRHSEDIINGTKPKSSHVRAIVLQAILKRVTKKHTHTHYFAEIKTRSPAIEFFVVT